MSLIAQAEALRETVEWLAASETVKELRQAWLKTGPVDKALTPQLEERFHGAVQEFFDRRKAFQSDRKALARRTVERYRELVNQAEALKNSDQFEAVSRQLKQLQTAWREVNGNLPRSRRPSCGPGFGQPTTTFLSASKTTLKASAPPRCSPGAVPGSPGKACCASASWPAAPRPSSPYPQPGRDPG
ncbi:MAG: DUF349 domain-containing protein [Hymenobacter sp.]